MECDDVNGHAVADGVDGPAHAAPPMLGTVILATPEHLERVKTKFFANVQKGIGPAGECWQWTGGRSSTHSPCFRLDAWSVLAASRACMLLLGYTVPREAILRRHCSTPACVLPLHQTMRIPAPGPRPQRLRMPDETKARIRHEYVAGIGRAALSARYQVSRHRIWSLTRDLTVCPKET